MKKTPAEVESSREIPKSLTIGELSAFVLQSVADGILVTDTGRKITYANDVLAGIYNTTPEALVGKSCTDLIGFDHCSSCPHKDVLAGGGAYTGHNLRCDRLPDRPYCVSVTPLVDEQREVVGVVELFRDMRALGAYIDDIEGANARLESERRRLDEILTDSSDGYYTADPNRKILSVDPKLLSLLGRSEEETVGRSCADVFGSDKCETDCPIVWAVKNRKNVIDCREQVRSANGILPVDKSVFAHEDAAGELTHVIGVIHNASEIVALRRAAAEAREVSQISSLSPKMEQVFELIRAFGPTDASILVLGESGTGKELVARAIQEASPRTARPFLKINCSALAEGLLESELFGHIQGAFTGATRDKKGKFEAADGGTIFLDEVGDMSPGLQTKVLRVLEEHEFEPVGSTETRQADVRIIAATNRDLPAAVRDRTFREDLYYRLNAIQIHLPPLRERPEDIPLLVQRFLADPKSVHGRGVETISARALDVLTRYSWPGNVRELRNAIDFASVCARGARIERGDLPEHIRNLGGAGAGGNGTPPLRHQDPELVEAMERFDGQRAEVARALGISRTTLWRRLKALEKNE